MLNNTPIEETFRTTFENFEADVNAQVWTNIEKQITTASSPSAGNAASQAAKSIVSASKFSALTYGIASVVIIAIVAATYFYLKPDQKVISNLNPVTTTQQPFIIENKISDAPEINTAETKHENNLSSQKPENRKATESASPVGGITPLVKEQENVANDNKENVVASTDAVTNNRKQEPKINNAEQTGNASDKNNEDLNADKRHETPRADDGTTEKETNPLEQVSQNDNFDWGIIPNLFSPNNDGINDVFALKIPDLKSLEVTILDRNEKTIFKWNNVRGFWDGKDFNGKEMPSGAYLYIIFVGSADGKHHSKTGTLNIFR